MRFMIEQSDNVVVGAMRRLMAVLGCVALSWMLLCVGKGCVLLRSRGGAASVALLAHVAVRIQDHPQLPRGVFRNTCCIGFLFCA